MFIKLGIIAGIVILGGVIFSTEINNIFPSTSAAVVDSLKTDVVDLSTKTSDSIEQRIDESIDQIVTETNNAGNKISNEIHEAQESSQKLIAEEISDFNPIESLQNLFIW